VKCLLPFVLASTLLLAGCASTQLTLNLDLYDDESAYVAPLAPGKIAALHNAMDKAEREAQEWATRRNALADQLFNAYRATLLFNSVVRTPKAKLDDLIRLTDEDLKDARLALSTHQGIVTRRSAAAQKASQTARGKLTAYMQAAEFYTQREPQRNRVNSLALQAEALRSVNDVQSALVQLSAPINSEFENSLVKRWPSVADSLVSSPLVDLAKNPAQQQQLQDLKAQVTKLADVIREAQDDGRIGANFAEQIRSAVRGMQSDTTAMGSVAAIAHASWEVSKAMQLGDRGRTALNDLTVSTTLLHSQLDRLQDPADPMWRIVTAPQNEKKWNSTFSKTYFYSEGNNSVVVVRDSPMSFRVQQGNNNPSALVESQLHISRAVANGAIAIAGAAIGAPGLPGLTPASPSSSSPAPQAADAPTDDFAIAKARNDRVAAVRAGALKNLQTNLTALRAEFSRLKDDKKSEPARQDLLRKMQAIIEGHQPLFESAAPSNQGTP
jgi:hypothetical protein